MNCSMSLLLQNCCNISNQLINIIISVILFGKGQHRAKPFFFDKIPKLRHNRSHWIFFHVLKIFSLIFILRCIAAFEHSVKLLHFLKHPTMMILVEEDSPFLLIFFKNF